MLMVSHFPNHGKDDAQQHNGKRPQLLSIVPPSKEQVRPKRTKGNVEYIGGEHYLYKSTNMWNRECNYSCDDELNEPAESKDFLWCLSVVRFDCWPFPLQ
eukprot:TRINITY_DN27462_c0_g1_i1.p3 TRINITY_DN27462_c0_g1~~TRINITY_DN27462_c0_g1_i1.p3  ORF type:complete len:100 (-),score=11.29 TRINITY_DN27462_c0_g1_i1:339-638(-)